MRHRLNLTNEVSRPDEIALLEIRNEEGDLRAMLYSRFSDPMLVRHQALLIETQDEGAIPTGRQFSSEIPARIRGSLTAASIPAGHLHIDMAIGLIHATMTLKGSLEGETAQATSMNDFDALVQARHGTKYEISEAEDVDILDLRDHSEIMARRPAGGGLSCSQAFGFKPNVPIGIDRNLGGFDILKVVGRLPDFQAVQRIDVELARDILASAPHASSGAVSFYGDRSHPRHEVREQAGRSYPVLAGVIADTQALRGAVDRKDPLQPIIEKLYGLKKSSMKRLRKVTEPAQLNEILPQGPIADDDAHGINRDRHRRVSTELSLHDSLRTLGGLPPDWTPQGDDEWRAFNDILSAVAIPLDNLYGIPTHDTLSLTKGKWEQFRATLANAADRDVDTFDRRTMAVTVLDAAEMVSDFRDTVVLPQVLASIKSVHVSPDSPGHEPVMSATKVAMEALTFGAKNVPAALFTASRAHTGLRTGVGATVDRHSVVSRDSDLIDKYGTDRWPRLVEEPFQSSNGLRVLCLSSAGELRDEGDQMKHCVGSYGYDREARIGRAHLFSIRDSEDTPLSTIEVAGKEPHAAAEEWRNAFQVRQHRGSRNSRPPETCFEALDEFEAGIKNGSVPLNLGEVQDFQVRIGEVEAALAREGADPWRGFLKFDYLKDEARADIWSAWRDALPKGLSKSDDSGVIYRLESARNLVGELAPVAAKRLAEQSQRPANNAEREDAAPAGP